ncbi:MAG: nucleotide exchange factor GrpE [Mariprofundaceae bacterium]
MSDKHGKAGTVADKDIREETDIQDEAVEAAESQPVEISDEEVEVIAPEDEAQAEIAELKDKLLRAYAEMDNVRKRARRDIEDARKFGIERFATELLGVVDNLERALETGHDNAKALQDGVRMTLESWHELMKKFDIQRIDAVGQKLDPHVHEAIAHLPNDATAGMVIEQHLPGYTLHGRLLRAAMVVVSSGPADEKKTAAEAEK